MKLNIVHNLSPCLHKRLVYGSIPLELAETRPGSNFSESRYAFSKVRSAKLNTDVKILVPDTDYFGKTALKDVRAQNFPHTDFVKTLTAGRE